MKKQDFENYTIIQQLAEPIHAGEAELKQFFRDNDYKVIDVSANPKYFSQDIDLFIQNPFTDKIFSLEVKWDSRIADTGNLFIEIWADYQNKIGWFNFCKADLLCYGDAQNNCFYIFDFAELKEYIEFNRCSFDSARCYDSLTGNTSWGLLVPLEALKEAITCRKIQLKGEN